MSVDARREPAGYHAKQDRAAIDFAELKRAVSLAMILSRYRYLSELKRVGSQLAGPCPICGADGRAFVAHLASNNWYCFARCNRGGGVLDFVALRDQLAIPKAAQLIAEWFSLGNSLSTRTAATSHRRTSMSNNSRPSHRAYVVEDREGDTSNEQGGFWTRIGSAWPHKDEKGLNIVLAALPVNGRVVLREYTDEDAEIDEGKRKPAKK